MALGTTTESKAYPAEGFEVVAPCSLSAEWQTIISAGGITQDAATITNPTSQITASTKTIFWRKGKGTLLLLRMKYDSTLTAITSPIVKVFGRKNSGEQWQLLYSKGGNIVETLSVDTTNDSRNGTFSWTTPNITVHAWDCLGCEELLVGVQTALAGATGSVSTATVEAKCI